MKSFLMVFGLGAALAVFAEAQSNVPARADVPFGFHVGDTYLPAGTYDVARANERVLRIGEVDGKHHVLRTVVAGGGGIQVPDVTALVFRRYGNDRYFLGEIRYSWTSTSVVLPPSKTEKEAVTSKLVASARPVEVIIVARVR